MTQIISELAITVRDGIRSHKVFNDNWRIDLQENSDVITLLGSVPKDNEKIVEGIVKKQNGVMSVINELNIIDLTDNQEKQAINKEDCEPNPIRILAPRRQADIKDSGRAFLNT